MGNSTESLPLSRKQAKKVSKRKKMEALLRISALNDKDRQALSGNKDSFAVPDIHEESKQTLKEQGTLNCPNNDTNSTEACCVSPDEPSPKRHKPDPTTIDAEEMPLHGGVFPVTFSGPCNIASQKQQTISLLPNGTSSQPPPQLPQHVIPGAQPSPLFCSNFCQNNIPVQVSKAQPVFSHLINGFPPVQLVPAFLVPEVRNVSAILGNSLRDSSNSYFDPTAITFMPVVCGYPFADSYLSPGPNVWIHNLPNRTIPVNDNPPPTENKDDVDEDLKNLRKSLKARKKEARVTPRFLLSAIGDTASLSTREADRIPIFTADLQRLILRATVRGGGRPIDIRCGHFKNVSHISGVKLLLLEGLSLKDVERSPELSTLLSDIFPVQMECIMPPAYEGALLEELAAVPLTADDRINLIKRWGSLEYALQRSSQIFRVLRAFFPIRHKDSNLSRQNSTDSNSKHIATVKAEPASPESRNEQCDLDADMSHSPKTDKFPRTLLLMSAWQMIEENYPLPIKGNIFKQFENFGMTKDEYKEVSPSSPMYGLDCEMCLTTLKKHELTRISVINEKHELIYDTLVKPPNKIINYLTEFSGITKEMMKGVTTTLQDVQEKLREILEPDAILVGQSLNSDLVALQLMHPYVIDTSIIFNLTGDRCRKSKLKYLAKAFLQIDIQHDAAAGHDPVEDAATALKLVQLKLSESLEFGDAVLSQLRNVPFPLLEKLEEQIAGEKLKTAKRGNAHTVEDKSKDDNIAVSVFRYLNRQTVNIIGNPDIVEEYHKYTYIIENWDRQKSKMPKLHRPNITRGQDERDIVDKAVQCMNQSFCTIAHVRLEQTVPELLAMKDKETTERFKTIINDFNRAAPLNSVVLLVLGGNSDGANGAVYLNVHKRAFTQTCKFPIQATSAND